MNNLINPSNNKLLSIIDSLSKVELNRLKKFIESPYFNVNQDISSLFDVIYSQYGKGLTFTKFGIWNLLNYDTEFDSLRFRKLYSDLLKLTEQFLSQEIYERNKILKANYLIKSVAEKELDKLYSSSLSNARRTSERSTGKASEYYLNQYHREKYIHELHKFHLNRSLESNLKEIIDNLDYFYLAEKMRLLCSILMRKDVSSFEYNILFKEEIIDHLKKYAYTEVPIVPIYFQMYQTLQGNEDSTYYKLKDLLELNIHIFPKSEAKEIYTNVINYCIRKINSGQNEFLHEFVKLNETLLEKNIIADNELSPWRFKNIITAGLKLSKFQWVESFIEKYKGKVSKNYRENAITFNTAQLYFYQKKYEELLPILLQVQYEDFTYSLSSKLITCITYFELNETEALFSYLESFRAYLSRQNNISNDKKKWNLNFISNTKKLLKFDSSKKNVYVEMKNKIEQTKDTAAREWLLEKIDQLLYPNGTQRDSAGTKYSNKQYNQDQ